MPPIDRETIIETDSVVINYETEIHIASICSKVIWPCIIFTHPHPAQPVMPPISLERRALPLKSLVVTNCETDIHIAVQQDDLANRNEH